jgi:predicted TIM-barrel fold metal-dependent hydrolase
MTDIKINNVTLPNFRFPFCDSHLHAFRNHGGVIKDFKDRYADHFAQIGNELEFYGDFSVERLVTDTKKVGCSYGIVKNIADIDPEKPGKGKSITAANNWAVETSKAHPNLFVFGTIHPDFEKVSGQSAEGEIQRLAENGIRGLSFDSCWQNFRPEGEKMIPLFRKMAELNLKALFHMGYDKFGKYPENLTWAKHILAIHNNIPTLKIIACHLGPPEPGQEESNLWGTANIWIDTAYVPQFIENFRRLSIEQLLRIIEKHDINNILFGSDYPWTDQGYCANFIWNLPLSEEEKRKILYSNFLELFGLTN